MPSINKSTTDNATPEALRPYVQHGMDLMGVSKERVSQCPFCGSEKKFSVNEDTGQWRCFTCGGGLDKGGGGIVSFLKLLWETSDKATTSADYAALAKDIGLDYPETVMKFGIAKSVITGHWLIPGWGYGKEGKLVFQQLYIYSYVNGRMACMATTGRPHTLIGMNLYDPANHEIQVCEGWKDTLRWWEVARSTKIDAEGALSPTASVDSSVAHGVSIVGASTCSAFPTLPGKVVAGKTVTFLYDNDHPKIHPKTGEPMAPVGYLGMKRDTLKVMSAETVRYIAWGEGGYDPELPNGFDLRDALKDKSEGVALIFNKVDDVPAEWRSKEIQQKGTEIQCRPCSSWKELTSSWRKSMKWTPGLDHGMASMLASIVSTNSVGDQLWLKIIGPASCGKSTLCEAVSVNHKHILAKSTIRGFHSGYKTDSASTEDNGLIPQLKGKTLVTKDGDTLLQSPNLGQILSEARDLYDSVSRTHYRNKMSRDYVGIRMTWLLCGTSSLRSIDTSELGERFLDCVIMEGIDEDLEDEILFRKVNQVDGQIGVESNGDITSHYSPALLDSMELTGGYIDWLKDNAANVLPTITASEWAKRQCVNVGKFVAYMRARPSKLQSENPERELAVRLVSQHMRYAKCLAYVLNRKEVDDVVVARTRQIGFDTARGIVLETVKLLYEAGGKGMTFKSIAYQIHQTEVDTKNLLRFMRGIGICLYQNLEGQGNVWLLTRRLRKLYEEVSNPTQGEHDGYR